MRSKRYYSYWIPRRISPGRLSKACLKQVFWVASRPHQQERHRRHPSLNRNTTTIKTTLPSSIVADMRRSIAQAFLLRRLLSSNGADSETSLISSCSTPIEQIEHRDDRRIIIPHTASIIHMEIEKEECSFGNNRNGGRRVRKTPPPPAVPDVLDDAQPAAKKRMSGSPSTVVEMEEEVSTVAASCAPVPSADDVLIQVCARRRGC